MYLQYKILAVIPARGGSKRVPRKNIKMLAGKPLVAYSIEAAKKSKYIDRLITSTDDTEIAEVARDLGSEVPFMRPAELAADTSNDHSVFQHALTWFQENEGWCPDMVVQLRPTSPLRTTDHIDAAIELLAKNPTVDSVRTVTRPEQSPYKMYKINEENLLEPVLPIPDVIESFNLPHTQLPKAYKHVGYVDVVWVKTVQKGKMTGEKVMPLIIEDALSGIDTDENWDRYEYLISKIQK